MKRPHRTRRNRSRRVDPHTEPDPVPVLDLAQLKRDCETSALIGGWLGNLMAGFMRGGGRGIPWYHPYTRDDDIGSLAKQQEVSTP